MRIESGLTANCSEAVFRCYTDAPDVAHRILQAFADEVAAANGRTPERIRPFHSMAEVQSVAFGACAGLGDAITKCIWEPDRKAFVLCIGNNDILPDGKGCNTVRELSIRVEEAENCKDLLRYARDCTCGNVFFPELLPAREGGA